MDQSTNGLDPTLVTVGAPAEGGCVYTSFSDSPTLPTGAAQRLDDSFVSLGELSPDGFTEQTSISSTQHRGWHGTVLLTTVDEETRTYQLVFLEVNRPAVACLRYGADKVDVDGDGNISHIGVGKTPTVSVPLVIDELMSNGWLRRNVVKRAQISNVDNVEHRYGALMGYGITFTAADVPGEDPIDIFFAKPASANGAGDGPSVGSGD